MSKFLWKGLLVSPAVLAASLVLSSTALAAEQPLEISVAAQPNNLLQLAGSAKEAVKPEPEAVKAEPVSLASNSTVKNIETIENQESASLYEGLANAPVAQQAKEPENTVAPTDLSAEAPVAEQIEQSQQQI